jgi:hypothetical protein
MTLQLYIQSKIGLYDPINNANGVIEMFSFLPFFRKSVAPAIISDRRWSIATLNRSEKAIRNGIVARVDRTDFIVMR